MQLPAFLDPKVEEFAMNMVARSARLLFHTRHVRTLLSQSKYLDDCIMLLLGLGLDKEVWGHVRRKKQESLRCSP